MKRIIVTSTLLAFAVAGFAQQANESKGPSPEQVAQRNANALSEKLSLSEDQRSKAYSIYLDKARDKQKERESRMKEMQKQHERNIAQEKQQDEKISRFLNEDQKKSYQQFQTQRQQRSFRNNVPRIGMNRPGPQSRFNFRQDLRREQVQRFRNRDRFRIDRPQKQFQQRGPGQGRPDLRNDLRRGQTGQIPERQFNGRPQRQDFQNRPGRIINGNDSLQRIQKMYPSVPSGDVKATSPR